MTEEENDFSLKNLFVPLTTTKSIYLIILLGIIVFLSGLFNGFVWDDLPQIVQNPIIQSLQNLPSFFAGGTFFNESGLPSGFSYKPLLNLSFAISYALSGGGGPFMFHLFQIVLYIINTCLLFLVLKKFFKPHLAIILALVFLVHPINNENVFYIAATQEVLFFFFGILAFWIIQNRHSGKAFATAAFLLFLSLLSKETGILFVLATILYLFIFNRQNILKFIGFLIAPLAVYAILRLHAFNPSIQNVVYAPIYHLSLVGRLINMPAIFLFYLKTFIYPVDLSMSYQWVYRQIAIIHFFTPLALDLLFLGVMASFAYFIYKKNEPKDLKIYSFFTAWFLLGIILHLQILPLDQTVADRWFYFPMVGLLGMIGVALTSFKVNIKNTWIICIIGIILILLSYRMFVRSFDWKDDYTAVLHDIQVSPESYNLEGELSYIYINQGKYQDAKVHAIKSIQLTPNTPNYINLGVSDIELGNYPEAKNALLKSLTLGDSYLTYDALAALATVYGDPAGDINFIKNVALKKYPQDWKLWFNLAELEYTKGDKKNAKLEIFRAYLYNPNPPVSALYNAITNNLPLNIKMSK